MGSKNVKSGNKKNIFRVVIALFLISTSIILGMVASTFANILEIYGKKTDTENVGNNPSQGGGLGQLLSDIGTAIMPMSEPVNILFMGSDVGYTSSGKKDDSVPTRTDTMILVRVDPITKKVSALSIPRDTRAKIAEKDTTEKINAAFAYGGEKLARKTVANLTGVPIHHFVLLKVEGVINIIDAIGGIDIFIEKDMVYKDWTAKLFINLKKGNYHLDGKHAHQYLRFRHDEIGDIGRVQRQQRFVNAVLKKMLNPMTMFKLPELVDIIQKNVVSDLSNGEMMKIGNFVRKLKREDIKMVMLPGNFGERGGASYWLTDDDKVKETCKTLFPDSTFNTPTDISATQKPDTLPSDKLTLEQKRNIKLTVLNGTKEEGLGSKAARMLRDQGWVVWNVDSADNTNTFQTQVILQSGKDDAIKYLAPDLGLKGFDIVKSSVGDISTDYTIIVGKDFQKMINLKQGKPN
ncbi:MAG: LCP family protein [Candidatus Sericytochromatia bacterium]